MDYELFSTAAVCVEGSAFHLMIAICGMCKLHSLRNTRQGRAEGDYAGARAKAIPPQSFRNRDFDTPHFEGYSP